jgi:TRAP-type mannitol/chloroaromatic compound transport system substrate-binding protein
MKRLGISAIAATMMLGLSVQADAQEYQWTMATLAPSENSIYFTIFAEPLAANIEELTNGRVVITPYPAGVLAPAFEVYSAVQDGIADVGNTWPGYIVNQDPTNSLLSAHPGGMGPAAYLTWLYEGGGQELWQEFRRETMGLHVLVAGAGPTEIHFHSRRAVREIADLEGLRVRMSSAAADIMTGFGAAPLNLPGHEIYTALERGTVDAAEWSTPAENMVAGLHEAAPYASVPGIHQPSFAFEFLIPTSVWDELPDDIKSQIEAAAKLTTFEAYYAWAARDVDALEQLAASDSVELVQLSDDYLQAWREAGQQWAEDRAQDNEWMRRVADSYYGFLSKWEDNARLHLNQKAR